MGGSGLRGTVVSSGLCAQCCRDWAPQEEEERGTKFWCQPFRRQLCQHRRQAGASAPQAGAVPVPAGWPCAPVWGPGTSLPPARGPRGGPGLCWGRRWPPVRATWAVWRPSYREGVCGPVSGSWPPTHTLCVFSIGAAWGDGRDLTLRCPSPSGHEEALGELHCGPAAPCILRHVLPGLGRELEGLGLPTPILASSLI